VCLKGGEFFMRRFISGLLAAAMIFGSAAATTYSNKTFLTPRSNNMNLAMEYTTWHKQISMIDDKKFGGSIQATGFYEESTNEKDLGKYFGVCGADGAIKDYLIVYRTGALPISPLEDIASDFIFHTYDVQNWKKTLADKLTWRPDRKAYGVRLDYHQKLDKLLNGLYFKVTLPIVHVKTSMGWSSSCTACGAGAGGNCSKQRLQSAADTLGGDLKSLGDYLTGNVVNDYANAKQVALCKAKIHNSNSETGVADIDVILGYNFIYKKDKHININIGVTIPTGNDPSGEYIWEAVVGNHDHWGLGFGLDSSFEIWKDDEKSLDFLLVFNYRYLFSSKEMRTMGMYFPSGGTIPAAQQGKKVPYGHWYLGAKKGDKFATPMANFLTRNIKVTPGSHFDGIVQLAFNYQNWTFDLGYNLFAKESENVRLKCVPCATGCSPSDCDGWTDGTYAIINAGASNWDTTAAFLNVATHAYGSVTIDTEHLDLSACTSPAATSHKLYGGIGHAFNDWDYPLMLGIGGSYEWGTDNDSLDQWALWAKIGLRF
jgi:hypothetical protein